MKLYAFQPNGHGELSYFTIAESEEQARQIVSQHIKKNHTDELGRLEYEAQGWGTDYYSVTVVEVGGVIENNND